MKNPAAARIGEPNEFAANPQAVPIFWRCHEVLAHVPFSRSTLLRLVKAGEFPKPVKLAQNVVVWRADAVINYLETAGGVAA